MVGLAEQVATLLADGRIAVLREVIAASKQLGLTHSQLVALVTDLQSKVKGLAEVLSLDLPQGRDYREVLLEAQQKLAHAAGEAAIDLLAASSNVRQANTEALFAMDESRNLMRAAESALAPASPARRAESGDAGPGPNPTGRRGIGFQPVDTNSKARQDPGLQGWLGAAVARCRELRQPLALVLVELDRHPQLIFMHGVETARRLHEQLENACERVAPEARVFAAADARLALVLANFDRSAAVRAANELLAEVRAWNAHVTASIGIAAVNVPPRNFPAAALQEAADRCLFAAQSCGGNCLKSIEVA
jgi:GGDEF domain-containing protein